VLGGSSAYFFLLALLLLAVDLLALLFDFALEALFFVPLDLVGMTHAPSAAQTRNCARRS
jgi:hypothetical protein